MHYSFFFAKPGQELQFESKSQCADRSRLVQTVPLVARLVLPKGGAVDGEVQNGPVEHEASKVPSESASAAAGGTQRRRRRGGRRSPINLILVRFHFIAPSGAVVCGRFI